jgi:hypothetical protein
MRRTSSSTILAFMASTLLTVAAEMIFAQDKPTDLRDARAAVEANMITAAGKAYAPLPRGRLAYTVDRLSKHASFSGVASADTVRYPREEDARPTNCASWVSILSRAVGRKSCVTAS